jgi:hypothetical protein
MSVFSESKNSAAFRWTLLLSRDRASLGNLTIRKENGRCKVKPETWIREVKAIRVFSLT